MKDKLISVLSQCASNKSFNQFNLILTMINYLKHDSTTINSVKYNNDEYIAIKLKHAHHYLSVYFYHNNNITITLPLSGLFIINNDSYNIQYNDIKSILLNNSI